jgi:hypothetical protein
MVTEVLGKFRDRLMRWQWDAKQGYEMKDGKYVQRWPHSHLQRDGPDDGARGASAARG